MECLFSFFQPQLTLKSAKRFLFKASCCTDDALQQIRKRDDKFFTVRLSCVAQTATADAIIYCE